MRLITLYLRARQVPLSLAAAVAAVVLIAPLGGDPASLTTTVLAAGLAVGVFGHGLGGADVDLDRSTALQWSAWRAAHLVAVTAVVAAVVLLAFGGHGLVVLRDVAGLAGLSGIAAAGLGKQFAWTLPVTCAGTSVVFPAMTELETIRVLTWPVQPVHSMTALCTGYLLAAGGLAAYVVRGIRG